MSKEMLEAFDSLEREKGIKKEVIIEALESALVAAYKKNYGQAQNVEVKFDEKKGNIKACAVKTVVEEVQDDRLEVSLTDALAINKAYELGDEIRFEVTPKDFGRIAAQTAKQVIMQRIREAERANIISEYEQYLDEVVSGIVQRKDNRYVYINIGRIDVIMAKNDQMANEHYNPQDRVKVLVTNVGMDSRGPQINVSRTSPNLVKRLFEQEVPEIYDGTVEIVSIAREAGDRTKIAVKSDNPDIDPIGTSVGPRGSRVQNIVNELHGENMDIVKYEEDPSDYIANALNPAEVIAVQFDEESNSCLVIVPDYQLSLAIGKKGQNVRLAARLTGYKIDIKPESEVEFVDDDSDTSDVADENYDNQLDEEIAEGQADIDAGDVVEEADDENEVADDTDVEDNAAAESDENTDEVTATEE